MHMYVRFSELICSIMMVCKRMLEERQCPCGSNVLLPVESTTASFNCSSFEFDTYACRLTFNPTTLYDNVVIIRSELSRAFAFRLIA